METYAVTGLWQGKFDEDALQEWAEKLRAQLAAPRVSLGILFMSPEYFPIASQVLELVRVHAQVPMLVGCSSAGLIIGAREVEDADGLVLALYSLPGANLRTFRFTQEQVEEADGPAYWRQKTGLAPDDFNGWLVLADPFHLDAESWLRQWTEAYAPKPIFGGLASGTMTQPVTQVYLDGAVYEEGGVGLAVGGDVELHGVISQGCTPIGETWTITRAEQNFIHEIGNRPAYEVLVETFNSLPPREQQTAPGNLFIGLVINEYLEDFHRGDFLVRNIIGADPHTGSLAVGAFARQGQTLQFQRRDARAATEDMTALLERARQELPGRMVYGACLCCCNGRGYRLFGHPNHDAGLVQEHLGPMALTGFFCNGEIGPIGRKNFLHGYTAALALFMRKAAGSSQGL
jgi:small ligand-binding sensory domain FIST